MKNFERALNLAFYAHQEQVDKIGMPYILHPIRVAEMVDTEEEKMVAVLHDVVEDTPVIIETIEIEFGFEIADAVLAITHFPGERRKDYLDRVIVNDLARTVKLADMRDNTDPKRNFYLPIETQLRLAKKYTIARHYLLTGEWND